ncbi:MAG: DNA polymerase III epsilon subunit family exonuclease [Candidatus Paceibacteria bacterium]|jgi:DNA polymerase-3 subunit epsilon
MKNKNLAFIDIETTGFNVETQEIIEIGCVIVKQQDGVLGEVVEEFELKIQPMKLENADPEALSINGYNEAEWLFAMTLEQAIKTFAEKTKECIFVAHNAAFDWSFIAKAFATTNIENKMFYAKIDTISFAFAKLHKDPSVTRYSLGSLCERFGITNDRAHTALADTRATVEVYRKLLEL